MAAPLLLVEWVYLRVMMSVSMKDEGDRKKGKKAKRRNAMICGTKFIGGMLVVLLLSDGQKGGEARQTLKLL